MPATVLSSSTHSLARLTAPASVEFTVAVAGEGRSRGEGGSGAAAADLLLSCPAPQGRLLEAPQGALLVGVVRWSKLRAVTAGRRSLQAALSTSAVGSSELLAVPDEDEGGRAEGNKREAGG